jgi:uncharacterized protein (DUF58 family)
MDSALRPLTLRLKALRRRWNPPGRAIAQSLELHFLSPSYSGVLLGILAIFFFIAASNTLAGWLYVMSGLLVALLAIAAVLARRMLQQVQVRRWPITPVTAGDMLSITLAINNPTKQTKNLLQVQDDLPLSLGPAVPQVVEFLSPGSTQHVTIQVPTTRRGIYRWQKVDLRTGAPLGLFWGRRSWRVRAIATVYPQVLPLSRCPLLDELGRDQSLNLQHNRVAQASNDGMTRSLRPYRWGDPIRLVHWRSSAKHGELRLRELETMTSGQDVVIALDTSAIWNSEQFESAVIAAASLYFYGRRQQLNVSLWTAKTGPIQGEQNILQALAATYPGEVMANPRPEAGAMVWLSSNGASLDALEPGQRWMLWSDGGASPRARSRGHVVVGDRPLDQQLQSDLPRV